MDSSSTNHSNQEEDDDNNNSNSSRHHAFHVFSPPPPAPQPPLSQPPPPPQSFWNFLSNPPLPPSSLLSHQRLFHTSSSSYTTNNASALNFTLTHRPSGRGGGRNSSNHHQPCAPGSASNKPNHGRKTELLIAAAAAASSPSTTMPQPSSPSPPCTECGRRFPSSKALFGHMRCHPERTWRGINPPSNARRTLPATSGTAEVEEITEEEFEVAETLIFLATGVYPKRKTTNRKGSSAQTAAAAAGIPESGTPEETAEHRSNGRALDESHGQAPGTINVHGEGNDRFGVDTPGGRHAPPGRNIISLQERRGRGGGHVFSSSSSRTDIPDLNLPLPSPENEEIGNDSWDF